MLQLDGRNARFCHEMYERVGLRRDSPALHCQAG